MDTYSDDEGKYLPIWINARQRSLVIITVVVLFANRH